MKAIVYEKYGSPDVLELKDIEKPAPKGKEVLVKVMAASVNAADLHLLQGDPFLLRMSSGLLKPKEKILGADIAGRVEAVGSAVKGFKPGDEVFGDLSACGRGGFAEYVCAVDSALVLKPKNLGFDEAAAAPMAAVTALQGLRGKGKIKAGQKVLVYGASGGVGSFAVQIAKALGAETTAVCSAGNAAAMRKLGADRVIDYAKEDCLDGGLQYDLILAANGDRSIFEYKRALKPRGAYVVSGGSMAQIFQAMLLGPWISMTGGQKMGSLLSLPNAADLAFIKDLLEAGKVVALIDRRYPLRETAEACRYLDLGHAKGKVVISVGDPR